MMMMMMMMVRWWWQRHGKEDEGKEDGEKDVSSEILVKYLPIYFDNLYTIVNLPVDISEDSSDVHLSDQSIDNGECNLSLTQAYHHKHTPWLGSLEKWTVILISSDIFNHINCKDFKTEMENKSRFEGQL